MLRKFEKMNNLIHMFGLRRQVDEYYFGYREVREFNPLVVVMPNFAVVRFLTTGNKANASEYLRKVFLQVEEVASEVRTYYSKYPPSENIANAVVDKVLMGIADGRKTDLLSFRRELEQAAALGFILGKLDKRRLGERPPVALGIHDETQTKLAEQFVEECKWIAAQCISKAFVLTRAGVLK